MGGGEDCQEAESQQAPPGFPHPAQRACVSAGVCAYVRGSMCVCAPSICVRVCMVLDACV